MTTTTGCVTVRAEEAAVDAIAKIFRMTNQSVARPEPRTLQFAVPGEVSKADVKLYLRGVLDAAKVPEVYTNLDYGSGIDLAPVQKERIENSARCFRQNFNAKRYHDGSLKRHMINDEGDIVLDPAFLPTTGYGYEVNETPNAGGDALYMEMRTTCGEDASGFTEVAVFDRKGGSFGVEAEDDAGNVIRLNSARRIKTLFRDPGAATGFMRANQQIASDFAKITGFNLITTGGYDKHRRLTETVCNITIADERNSRFDAQL